MQEERVHAGRPDPSRSPHRVADADDVGARVAAGKASFGLIAPHGVTQ